MYDEIGEMGTGSVWLVGRKDIKEEEKKEEVYYNTPRQKTLLSNSS